MSLLSTHKLVWALLISTYLFCFFFFVAELYMTYLPQRKHRMETGGGQLLASARAPNRNKIVCVCGRKFSYKGSYRYHLKWECGQDLSCPKCGRVFTHKSNLSTHVRNCMYGGVAGGSGNGNEPNQMHYRKRQTF